VSARFFIRREYIDTHRWVLRDALCRESENHDFNSRDWAGECTGSCDTFKLFSSAIGTASMSGD